MTSPVLYEDELVRITRCDAMVNAVSYPLDATSAVSLKEERRSADRLGALACVLAFGLFGIVMFAQQGLAMIGVALLTLGLAAAILLTRDPQTFALIVKSAGFHTAILKSPDREYLLRVKAAIETAVQPEDGTASH